MLNVDSRQNCGAGNESFLVVAATKGLEFFSEAGNYLKVDKQPREIKTLNNRYGDEYEKTLVYLWLLFDLELF